MRMISLRVAFVLAGAAATLGLAIGLVIPRLHPTATLRVADGHAAGETIGVETSDWSYSVPRDVSWVDTRGAWHDNGRPECLPADRPIKHLRFATVTVKIEGTTWRPVVWVDCRT